MINHHPQMPTVHYTWALKAELVSDGYNHISASGLPS